MSVYVPLPHNGECVRLLEVAPGKTSDDLAARFVVHNLNNDQREYTAMSYVCGDDDRSHNHVLISGAKLGIYKHADEVLRRFRSITDPVFLWIDVCCIDQDDPVEKAREVAVMYKTYQHAKRTVVWLGPMNSDASAAIQFARTLDPLKYLAEFKPTVRYAGYEKYLMESKSHILDHLDGDPQKESLINSSARFLLKSYFTRAWCQQEGSLSAEPIVVCGQEQLPWDSVFALSWLFIPRRTMAWPAWFLSDESGLGYIKLEPNLMFIQNVQTYRLCQIIIANKEPAVLQLRLLGAMIETARLNCYDPRDKIFAVRNMAMDLLDDDWAPQPDYVTPWDEIYTNFAVNMAERGQVQLVSWAGVCEQGDDSGLPSWVIDWRYRQSTQYVNHGIWCAGGKKFQTKAEIVPKKKRNHLMKMLQAEDHPRKSLRYTLQITILMQDTISYLGGVIEHGKILERAMLLGEYLSLDANSQAFIQALPYSTYITSEPILDAYNTTLIANTTEQGTLASPMYVSQGVKDWRSWLSSGASSKSNIAPEYSNAIDNINVFRYKHFCVSSVGYFCLVPHITLPTDSIVIVKGVDMPIVIRPVGEYYIHLGQCYIHGMMEPKAGELMEEFRPKYDISVGQIVIQRPGGDVRRNGRKMEAGEHVRILGTLGERKVKLI